MHSTTASLHSASAVCIQRSASLLVSKSDYQLERASSSIALNLAEGYGRTGIADQKRFYVIAMGSLRESQAILDLALKKDHELIQKLDILAAHLAKLIKCYP